VHAERGVVKLPLGAQAANGVADDAVLRVPLAHVSLELLRRVHLRRVGEGARWGNMRERGGGEARALDGQGSAHLRRVGRVAEGAWRGGGVGGRRSARREKKDEERNEWGVRQWAVTRASPTKAYILVDGELAAVRHAQFAHLAVVDLADVQLVAHVFVRCKNKRVGQGRGVRAGE